MLYFFPGFIVGALAALLLFTPVEGPEIDPEWWGAIPSIGEIEASPFVKSSRASFFVRTGDRGYHILRGNGGTELSGSVAEGLAAFSGDGRFHARYRKVGSEVEFFNAAGERFWRLPSLEYPYLSRRGRLIFLMNGDQSGIRIADYNGRILGEAMTGKTCTAIAFSDRNDRGAAGFLDGSYYFVDASGKFLAKGRAPEGSLVKGVAVSGNGRFGAVHYGNNRKDCLRIVTTESGDYDDCCLSQIHHSKTSLHLDDEGFCTVLDGNRVIRASPSGRIKLTLAVPAARPGHSSIRCRDGVCAVSFVMEKGTPMALLFRDDGAVLFTKRFPSESFLDASLEGELLLLRGSDHLFCYGIRRPGP